MIRKDYILFVYSPNKSNIFGFFDEEDDNIYVNAKLNRIERKLVFIHESQHRNCFNKKCKCWGTTFWCEYHAFRRELNFVLKLNKRRYWHVFFKIAIKELIKYKTHPEIAGWTEHFNAKRKTMKLNECVKYAKKYKYWEQIESIIK